MFRDSESVGRGLRARTFSTWDSRPWRRPAPALRSRRGCPTQATTTSCARDRNLAYIASITAAVDLPVSADFMSGYGTEPEDVAESVTRCVATGVAGLSIEDATGDPASPLLRSADRGRARPRRATGDRSIRRGRAADRKSRVLPRGPSQIPSANQSRRLQACVAAGADVLFAPGPQNAAQRSRRSSRRLRRGRSTFSWFGTLACVSKRSRRSACDASASAARWRWRRGPASCAPHRR